MDVITWIGIAFCISQSAMFSGLNLAFFSVSKMRLEMEAGKLNPQAQQVIAMRKDSNFLLATILWGNVGINVLLTLLSNSILAGVAAFIFSTVIITFLGEIVPQAYFSRNALRMASLLAPALRFYQILLYPVAKSSSVVLDMWLGKEGIQYLRESDLQEVIKMHMRSDETEIDEIEGQGALNFLALDDLSAREEGEPIDLDSILPLPFASGRPVFPEINHVPDDPFLASVQKPNRKWIVVVDSDDEPRVVIDSDGFLRAALFDPDSFNPHHFCHHPLVVKDSQALLGPLIMRMKVHRMALEDDVIDNDIIVLWSEQKRIITGADILGRLLRGIVGQEEVRFRKW